MENEVTEKPIGINDDLSAYIKMHRAQLGAYHHGHESGGYVLTEFEQGIVADYEATVKLAEVIQGQALALRAEVERLRGMCKEWHEASGHLSEVESGATHPTREEIATAYRRSHDAWRAMDDWYTETYTARTLAAIDVAQERVGSPFGAVFDNLRRIANDVLNALSALTAERDAARARIESQTFRESCANTPLMADVMRERDTARESLRAFAASIGIAHLESALVENSPESWRVHGAAISRFEQQQRDQIKELRAERDAANGLLRRVEWQAGCAWMEGEVFCPTCEALEADGHEPDCPIATQLAAQRGGGEG